MLKERESALHCEIDIDALDSKTSEAVETFRPHLPSSQFAQHNNTAATRASSRRMMKQSMGSRKPASRCGAKSNKAMRTTVSLNRHANVTTGSK
eukprot:scaffold29317_cov16-Tisochrysis_lutea.AAC.2